MKSFMPKVLFYYSAAAAFIIAVSTTLTSQTLGPFIFAVLFLPVTAYFIIEFFRQMRSKNDPQISPKKGEVLTITIIFLLLLGLSVRNIYIQYSISKVTAPQPEAISPLIFKTEATPESKKSVQISITDNSGSVNIRQKPTIYSKKIEEAKDGDIFEYTKKVSGWYEIKLADGSTGYISAKYIKEVLK